MVSITNAITSALSKSKSQLTIEGQQKIVRLLRKDMPVLKEIEKCFFQATRYYAIGGMIIGTPMGFVKGLESITTHRENQSFTFFLTPQGALMSIIYGIPAASLGGITGGYCGSMVPLFLLSAPVVLTIQNKFSR